MISIIGLGFVGTAIRQSFTEKSLEIMSYDIKIDTPDILHKCIQKSDMIFLCLPTEYNKENACFDKTAIFSICSLLQEEKYDGIVILKSTVEPQTTDNLHNDYKLNIIYNPEFLTTRTAYIDFHHQKNILIGNPCKQNKIYANKVKNFYSKHYPIAEIIECSSTEGELVKISINSFYDIKTQYFNKIHHLCDALNCNYNNVKSYMIKQEWINPMHTEVPSRDKKLNFGEHAFQKILECYTNT